MHLETNIHKTSVTHSKSGRCPYNLTVLPQIILSMKSGFILPNINYCTPLRGVEGLEKRRLAVVTEKVPLSDHQQLFGNIVLQY